MDTASIGSTSITYTYDGNGVLVKKVQTGGSAGTNLYIGGHYAVINGTARSTYMFGGKAVAVKNGSTLSYLYSDHLGSSSMSTNASGTVTSQKRYYPYGEVRWSSGTLPTDYTFTAQREEASLNGLMDYRARYYDVLIGRFVQADTVVPDPGNSQSWNRYMYTQGNPIKYNDPTGHDVGCPGDEVFMCQSDSSSGAVHYTFQLGVGSGAHAWDSAGVFTEDGFVTHGHLSFSLEWANKIEMIGEQGSTLDSSITFRGSDVLTPNTLNNKQSVYDVDDSQIDPPSYRQTAQMDSTPGTTYSIRYWADEQKTLRTLETQVTGTSGGYTVLRDEYGRIQGGDSGSPVYNSDGYLVGIVQMIGKQMLEVGVAGMEPHVNVVLISPINQ